MSSGGDGGGGGCLRKARSVASEQREGSQHNNMSFELCENRMHCSAAQCTSQLDEDVSGQKTKQFQQTCSAGGAGCRLSLCEREE